MRITPISKPHIARLITTLGFSLLIILTYIALGSNATAAVGWDPGVQPVVAAEGETNTDNLRLPLRIIPDGEGTFTVRGAGHVLHFTPSGVTFLNGNRTFQQAFMGATPDPVLEGLAPLAGVINEYRGRDTTAWREQVPTYGDLAYHDLYPGIDLIYRGTKGNLKREFLVSPGADPSAIAFTYRNVEAITLREDGALVVHTPDGDLIESAPFVYQEIDGRKQVIPASYHLEPHTDTITFDLGAYNPAYPLIIDPILSYSSFVGGSAFDSSSSIVVDEAGSLYITGYTLSDDFPTQSATQGNRTDAADIFVTKIITGSGAYSYSFSTYLGGSEFDNSCSLAVDNNGKVYITGYTTSDDFPIKDALDETRSSNEAFVARFAANGALDYSTYLGGSGTDIGYSIAVDTNNRPHITGYTSSSDFPTTTNAIQPTNQSNSGYSDAFLTVLNDKGDAYLYSSYLGGNYDDQGKAITLDKNGDIFLTGLTGSSDFPTTTNAIQPNRASTKDTFVAHIHNAAGVYTYTYNSYLGGSSSDEDAKDIAVDTEGNIYTIGFTSSTDFPTTTSALQSTRCGGRDAYLTQIIPGDVYTYGLSTYMGGSNGDYNSSIALANDGGIYIIGSTYSNDFPTHRAIQGYGGNSDAYAMQIVQTGSGYTYGYATYLGGGNYDNGNDLALDNAGHLYLTGDTDSTGFLTTTNALQPVKAGDSDAFIVRLSEQVSAPTLVAPTDNALSSQHTVTFTWQTAITDVTSYQLILNGEAQNAGAVTEITRTLDDGPYTWQVTALSGGGAQATSEARDFIIDTSAPVLSDHTPASSATGVMVYKPITITFSEPISQTGFTYTLTPDPGGQVVSWSADSKTVTIAHNEFAQDTTYTLSITTSDDHVGNTLTGAPITWSFTTANDATPPQVRAHTPANGQADLSLDANVVITFSRAMNQAFTYTIDPDPGTWSWDWSAGDTALTMQHADFAPDSTYTFTLTHASDADGHALANAPVVWHFTTAPDTTAPAVTGKTPDTGAAGVDIDAGITITFSESVNPASLVYTVTPDPGGLTPSWNDDRTVLTLNHSDFLYATAYQVGLDAVYDLAGNLLQASPVRWSFTSDVYPITPRYVAPTGDDVDNDCTASGNPCATIQHAVDEAEWQGNAGDEVRVAAGVYNSVNTRGGLSQITYISKSLTLRGGYNTDFSVWDPETHVSKLDSNDNGRGIYVSGPVSVTIEGLTIQDNSADGLGGAAVGNYDAGGGIYVITATATISGNIVDKNIASATDDEDAYGGGIYLRNSDSHLYHTILSQNDATTAGGTWGSMGTGGGLCADGGAPLIQDNTVQGNQAGPGSGFFGFGEGGGLAFIESTPTVIANLVYNNQAVGSGSEGAGGGIELLGCPAFTLTNNIVVKNTGGAYGANGIHIGDMSGQPSSGWLRHNTIASNRDGSDAAGLYVDAGVVGTNSTVDAANNIIVDHAEGVSIGGSMNATVTVNLTNTLWGEGTWANDTNWVIYGDEPPTHTINSALAITGTPDFNSPSGNDYHIGANSDAVDAGMRTDVAADIDHDIRDLAPDIGADEISGRGLQLTKETQATIVYPDDTVSYTLTVTGGGTLGVTGVTITDTLPLQMKPLSTGTDLGSCSINDNHYGGTITCEVGDLSAGQTAVITITAQVTTTEPTNPPETLSNTVQATGDQASATATAEITWRATPDCHVKINGAGLEYRTIQEAVSAASQGDTLWIAGTCLGTQGANQQAYLDKTLTLQGGYSTDFSMWDPDSYPTTLDAEQEGRVLLITDTAHITATHITITGGDATAQGTRDANFYGAGGGAYVSHGATAIFSHTIIIGNAATTQGNGLGGGVAVDGGTVYLQESRLAHNAALSSTTAAIGGYGGGLGAISATLYIEQSLFEQNTASAGLLGEGGGAYVYASDTTADHTTWISNTVSPIGISNGGGLSAGGGKPVRLTNNIIQENIASDGSAIWADTVPITISNTVIQGNLASNEGSAVRIEGTGPATMLHPTLALNTGRAAVSANFTTTVTITNAIIYSQTVGIEAEMHSQVNVDGMLWHQVLTPTVATTATIQVNHAITGNPAFEADGYHLMASSPAIDAGLGESVSHDIDGEARAHGTLPDLGADEFGNKPTADAGERQSVQTGEQVQLDGSGSSDPDGDDLTYAWQQTGGPDVGGPWSVVSPTFTAPDSATVLTFTLTVTDTGGLSDDDTLTVTVNASIPDNHTPTADAGERQSVQTGEQVQLDGSGSSDPDGDDLTYAWQQTGGPDVGGPWSAISPTFTAPDSATVLTFTLTVTDTGGLSDSDSISILVENHVVYLPLVIRQ